MNIVMPFHVQDFHLWKDLMDWMHELDGQLKAHAVLVFPGFLAMTKLAEIRSAALKGFTSFEYVIPSSPIQGWPAGPNYFFLETLKHQSKQNEPFLWLEPDAVPMRPEWFTRLSAEYAQEDVPFMGSINKRKADGFRHMSGVAVYPANALQFWLNELPSTKAFDMVAQEDVVPMCYNTDLIYNFWGQPGLSPTFKENVEKTDPENTMTLDAIPKSAVLFHRCKDGTLTSLLRKERYIGVSV